MPGVWDPSEWEELQTSTPPHQKTELREARMGNPCVPRYRVYGLLSKVGKGMYGRKDC